MGSGWSSSRREISSKAQFYDQNDDEILSYPASMTTLPDSRQSARKTSLSGESPKPKPLNSKTTKPKTPKIPKTKSKTKLSKPSKNCQVIGGHEKAINCIAIDKNNALLLTGSDDHTSQIWELSTGEKLADLAGHEGYTKCEKTSNNMPIPQKK